MPELPRINARESAGGLMSVSGSSSAFDSGASVGAGNLASGLLSASDTLSKMSQDIELVRKRRKQKEDVANAASAYNDFNLKVTNFLNENRNEPDAKKTIEYMRSQIKDFSGTLSKESADMFRQDAESTMIRTYAGVLDAENRHSISKLREANEKQGITMMAMYRDLLDGGIGLDMAGEQLKVSLDKNISMIQEQWSEQPATAREQVQKLVKEAIVGSSFEDPALAREILEAHDIFDADVRKNLVAQIEAKVESVNREARIVIRNHETDVLESNKRNMDRISDSEIYSLGAYTGAYGDEDTAKIMRNAFIREVNAHNTAIDQIEQVRGMSPAVLNNALITLRERDRELTDDHSEGAQIYKKSLSTSMPEIEAMYKMATENPVAYLEAYNDQVVKLQEEIDKEQAIEPPNEAVLADLQKQKSDLLWSLQGNPPDGVKDEDAASYMGNPMYARSRLSKVQAENFVANINRAQATEIPQMIAAFKQSFDTPSKAREAYNDLINLPTQGKGLDPVWQLAFWMEDPRLVERYAQSVKFARDIKDLSPEKKQDYEDALFRNESYMALQSVLMAETPDEANMFAEGLQLFALGGFVGEDPKTAIDKVVAMTLDPVFAFPEVGGEVVMIPKQRADGTIRDQGEPAQIVGGLQDLLREFDVSEIDIDNPANFPFMPSDKEMREVVMRGMKDSLYFKTLPNLHQAVLMVQGDDGFDFEAVDKKGNPFVVDFDVYGTRVSRRINPRQRVMMKESVLPRSRVYDWINK